MKKLKWLILVMCLVLGLSVFVACGGNDDNKGTNDTNVAATDVTVAPERGLYVGKSTLLTALISPWDANAPATWTSSDEEVVTVSTDGLAYGVAKITGVAVGEANVTVTVSGKTATCKVTVSFPESDIRIKGDYNGWGVTSLCAAGLNESNDFTATFTVKYVGDKKDFGLYSAKPGSTDQVAWARDNVNLDLTGVTGITNGKSNWLITEGVYEFTVTVDDAGKFTALTVTEGATEDENTIQIPPPPPQEYNILFHGGWDNDDENWYGIPFGEMVFDATHLTYTADVELKEGNFGIKPVVAGTETQSGWFNSDAIQLEEGVTTITKNAGGNATCTAAGTYNITITMDEEYNFTIKFNSYTAPAAE